MPKTETAADTASTDSPLLEPGSEGGTDDTASTDDQAARIAQLEADVAQRDAIIADLNERLRDLETVPARPAEPEAPKLIGEDWSGKTAAEAKAAGVTKTVLCSDGYYVPGTPAD